MFERRGYLYLPVERVDAPPPWPTTTVSTRTLDEEYARLNTALNDHIRRYGPQWLKTSLLADEAGQRRDYREMVRLRSIAAQERVTGLPWRPRRRYKSSMLSRRYRVYDQEYLIRIDEGRTL